MDWNYFFPIRKTLKALETTTLLESWKLMMENLDRDTLQWSLPLGKKTGLFEQVGNLKERHHFLQQRGFVQDYAILKHHEQQAKSGVKIA